MEELKVGDRVRHCTRGEGIVIEPPRAFVFYDKEVKDVYGLPSKRFYEPVTHLTKIKPKVNRYKWIFRRKLSGFISLSSEYYTKEECERAFPGCEILHAVMETERIDDE